MSDACSVYFLATQTARAIEHGEDIQVQMTPVRFYCTRTTGLWIPHESDRKDAMVNPALFVHVIVLIWLLKGKHLLLPNHNKIAIDRQRDHIFGSKQRAI
jgi:hypothetical protein